MDNLDLDRDVQAALNGARVGRDKAPFGSYGASDEDWQGDPSGGDDGSSSDDDLLTLEELAQVPPPTPLIGDILYRDTFFFLFAPPSYWKTFLAIAWGVCVAAGIPWMGRRVAQGPVIYIAGEGVGSIRIRVEACMRAYGVQGPIPFYVFRRPVLFTDEAGVFRFVQKVEAKLEGVPPALVFADTLALAMAGANENTAQDGGGVVERAKRLQRRWACAFGFLHHSGYDISHMRGTTSFEAAADYTLKAETVGLPEKATPMPGDAMRLLHKKPPRDAERFTPFSVTTEVAQWTERDAEGEAVTRRSLVVVPLERPTSTIVNNDTPLPDTSPSAKQFGKGALRSWRALNKFELLHPEGATNSQWEKVVRGSGTTMAHTTFQDTRRTLTDAGWVRKYGALYRTSQPGLPDDVEPSAPVEEEDDEDREDEEEEGDES